jgi:predicted short-subunit dehydrogenase-like oxidoreductase (DUF2520 family)
MTAAQNQFLLIGSGRVARHFAFYFESLGLSLRKWDRRQDQSGLHQLIEKSTHVLLLISDHSIAGFYKAHLQGKGKKVTHFSGALSVPEVAGAHPLMTFGNEIYPEEFYRQLRFVISGASSLGEILPGVPNSFTVILEAQRALYHSLCVLGGNFSAVLLQKMILEFQQIGIPKEASRLFIEQTVANIFTDPEKALTGPIPRRDAGTVQKNLDSLSQDSYQKIYRAFLELQWPDFPKETSL